MKNTLAQDLAWERWHQCEAKYPTVSLKEIKTDGQIWVWNYGGSDWAAMQVCLREAAQRQASRQPDTVKAVAVAVPVDPVARLKTPTWSKGDEWAFPVDGPTGKSTYVWAVEREEEVGGVAHYVLKTGGRELFYRKSDLAYTKETVDGVLVRQVSPSRLNYHWPMETGRRWEQTFKDEQPVARTSQERMTTWTIEGEETVSVPAGRFQAFKIVWKDARTGTLLYEEWFSPEVKQFVKIRERLSNGTRDRELIQYRLR